jgi:predicted nuclease with TOPRIM domain
MDTDDKNIPNNMKLLMEASRRLTILSDQMIEVENQNMKLKVLLGELEPRYGKLKKAFDELIEITLEYREKMGYSDYGDFEYEWYEKAGLL